MIVKNRQDIPDIRNSARQFLVCKNDEADRPRDRLPRKPPVGLKELSLKFPRMQKGKPFIDHVMNLLDAVDGFSVMLVRIDDFSVRENVLGKTWAARLLVDAATAMNTVCRKYNGIWGLIERDMFGCFFYEKDGEFCISAADMIRENFSSPRGETLTIGIALYPLARFTRIQTLKNARKALDHAATGSPGSTAVFNAESLSISGDKLYQQGEIRRAVEEFRAALSLDPSSVNIHNSLGVCYGALGAYPSALEEFSTASRLDSREVMPVYNSGLIHMMTGEREKALEAFLRAGRMDEGIFDLALQTGKIYLDMQDFENARFYLERAVRLRPDAGAAHRYAGECYAALNMPEKAIRAYKKAIRHTPNDAVSISALGCLFDLQGENPDIAIMFCRHSVEIAPENGLFHQHLGRLYLKQNRMEEALQEFETASRLGCDCIQYIEKIYIRQNKAS